MIILAIQATPLQLKVRRPNCLEQEATAPFLLLYRSLIQVWSLWNNHRAPCTAPDSRKASPKIEVLNETKSKGRKLLTLLARQSCTQVLLADSYSPYGALQNGRASTGSSYISIVQKAASFDRAILDGKRTRSIFEASKTIAQMIDIMHCTCTPCRPRILTTLSPEFHRHFCHLISQTSENALP